MRLTKKTYLKNVSLATYQSLEINIRNAIYAARQNEVSENRDVRERSSWSLLNATPIEELARLDLPTIERLSGKRQDLSAWDGWDARDMHANRGVNTLGRRRLSAGVFPVVRSVANCVELARCAGITLMQPKIGRDGLWVVAKEAGRRRR